MKKKWLLVLLVLMLALLVPVISACSCNNNGGNPSEPVNPDGPGTNPENPDTPVIPEFPETPEVPALPTGSAKPIVKYARIVSLGENEVTIKFNALGTGLTYDIRYSAKEITEKNFSKATKLDVAVNGEGEVKTATLPLTASATEKLYIAIRASVNDVDSDIITVRAGGIEKIKIDTTRPDAIYMGEIIRNAVPLIDEFDIVGDPLRSDFASLPTSQISRFFYPAGYVFPNHTLTEDDQRYGTNIAPIVDLEFIHYVDCIYLFYGQFSAYDMKFGVDYDVIVRANETAADFQTPSDWEHEYELKQNEYYDPATDAFINGVVDGPIKENTWVKIDIKDYVRYIQVEFFDGGAPTEMVVYGYQTGESEESVIGETAHKLPTIGEMMGMCALLGSGLGNCTIDQLAASTVVREYHNFGWAYNSGNFPNKATSLSNTVVGDFDALYKQYSQADVELTIIPCLQWNEASSPARVYNYDTGKLSGTVATWDEKYNPHNYVAVADLMYQYAARYGSSKMGYLVKNIIDHSDAPSNATVGRNYIQWIEVGNEPNGEDAAGATAYQLAALQSAAYDGHMRTLLADVYNRDDFTYFLGGKNADPDIKLAMAGLAGINDRYIATMVYWMRANRTDGKIAIDAFNYHTYFGKEFTLNGQKITVGVCPEEFGLAEVLRPLLEYRDKYYPEVELWLTEFGWDTNQSYETPTSAHVYGDYVNTPMGIIERAREIQGMWLVRAYLIMSAIGVDKATMYMCEDTAISNEMTSIGKYGTCGIWAYEHLESGETVYLDADGERCYKVAYTEEVEKDGEIIQETKIKWVLCDNPEQLANTSKNPETNPHLVAKNGYYYMYTLKKALGDMRFEKEIATGTGDVWLYQYGNDEGDKAFAVWCPTSDGTTVENFKVYVGDATSVTHITDEHGNIDGVHTELEVVDGYVTITVTEHASYIVIND